MSRIHDSAPAHAIGKAVDLVPMRLRMLTACEFIVGVDPVFADIHRYDEVSHNGIHYRQVAHCVQPFHQTHRPASDRGVKVVLPTNRAYGWETWRGPRVVLHELGHVLHWRTDPAYVANPVSAYARSNHYEAFAEAFAAWCWGEPIDARTTVMFEGLVDA